MKFLIDDQLPAGLARAMSMVGHEALHVSECGLGGRDDRSIWRHACAQGFVIVTKDVDFVLLQSARPPHAPVLWLTVGNTRKHALLEKIMPILDDIVRRFESGEMVVEIC